MRPTKPIMPLTATLFSQRSLQAVVPWMHRHARDGYGWDTAIPVGSGRGLSAIAWRSGYRGASRHRLHCRGTSAPDPSCLRVSSFLHLAWRVVRAPLLLACGFAAGLLNGALLGAWLATPNLRRVPVPVVAGWARFVGGGITLLLVALVMLGSTSYAADDFVILILVPAVIEEVTIPLEFRRIQAASLVDWTASRPHTGFDALVQSVAALVRPHQVGPVAP